MERRRGRTPRPLLRLLSPLRDFLATEAAGGVLLVAGALAALAWANSPWRAGYRDVWSTELSIRLGGHVLALDLRHWVNDALMTVFFFVVGLEIKREVTDGHLASRRAALLPMAAALGGMVVPIAVYLAIAGSTDAQGWAVPMATDIALAVGVLAVAGERLPTSMRALLLGLAIVDDIGAIVVIAVAYSNGVRWGWLAVAAAAFAVMAAARWFGVRWAMVYVVVGAVAWLGFHEAGLHPTLVGVAAGLLAPTRPHTPPELVDIAELTDLSSAEAVATTQEIARSSVSVVEWLQHVLHPWTSYAIVPVFALANAGIEISAHRIADATRSPITWGIIVGLVAGKPLGVLAAGRLAIRAGVADMPDGGTGRQLAGVGAAAGIGFTVALFIAELAFAGHAAAQADAKLAILVASALAAVVATTILRRGAVGAQASPAEQ